MKNRELSRQLQRLNNLIKKTSAASIGDLELQSHWAKYLCINCAGFLENAMAELYADYAKRKSNEFVSQYVSMQISRIQNPKSEKFLQTAYQFNKAWGDQLKIYIGEEGRKDAIDAIMNNRNRIAHGEDSEITVTRIQDYFKKIVEVIDFIENQCR